MSQAAKQTWPTDRAKWDFQVNRAVKEDEPRLRAILDHAKIELKTERWQWEQSGNLCIEYGRMDGRKSGLAITTADYWVHELRRDPDTICYFMFSVERLKALARIAYANGWRRDYAGDKKDYKVILIPLKWLVGLCSDL